MNRQPLEKLSNHRGHFQGFDMAGFQLRSLDGSVSWKFSMWNASGIFDYWLMGQEFRYVGTHLFDPHAAGGTTYEIGPIAEPRPVELVAIAEALSAWRAEAAEDLVEGEQDLHRTAP